METLNDLNRPPEYRPRNPWIAGGLSLFIPGLGQVYNGQLLKAGLIFVGFEFVFPFLAGIGRLGMTFNGLVAFTVLLIGIRLWIVVDAVLVARKRREYVLTGYEGLPALIVFGAFILLADTLIDKKAMLGTESFEIPNSISSPTVQEGDRAMADKLAYEENSPEYGHLIVFKDEQSTTLLYRVVGLPGDTISYLDNVLTINGAVQQRTTTGQVQMMGLPTTEFRETLPNGSAYPGYFFDPRPQGMSPKVDAQQLVVPAGEYFVLGDFRDNAQDSRFIGTIKREQIRGRLIYCWWGESLDRVGVDYTK